MSTAASRLIRFSNNASLQNLIQRHVLRPSASAAFVTQLVNTVTEPRSSSQFNTENPIPYLNTLPAQKAWCDYDIMRTCRGRSDRDIPNPSDTDSDADSGDEAFGDRDGGSNDSEFADFDDDAEFDDDDFDEDSTRKGTF